MRTFLLFIALISLSYCMYEHQVGSNDWHIKTFGQLQEVRMQSNKIFYLNTESQFGIINSQSGNVDRNLNRQQNLKFLWNQASQDPKFKLNAVLQTEQTLQLYNFEKNIFLDVSNQLQEQKILGYVYEAQSKVLLLTDTTLYKTTTNEQSDLELEEVLSVNSTERFVDLVINNGKVYIIAQENQSICLLTAGNQKYENKECVKLSNPFQAQNLSIANDFVLYTQDSLVIFDLKSGKTVQNTLGKSVLVSESQNLIIQKTSTGYEFFQLQNQKLQKKATFETQNTVIPTNLNNNSDSLYFVESNLQTGFAKLHQISNDNIQQIYQWPQSTQIKSIWLQQVGKQVNILLQTEDLQTTYYQINKKTAIWSTEESLAYIDNLKFIDYSHAIERHVSSYHELLDEKGNFNSLYLIPSILLRIQDEVSDLLVSFNHILQYGSQVFQALIQARSVQDLKDLNQIGTENKDYNIFYGLKKIILVATNYRNVFRLESEDGSIAWKKSLSTFIDSSYKLTGIFDLEERKEDLIHNEVLLVYHSKAQKTLKLLQIQPSNGDIKEIQSFSIEKPLKIVKAQKDFNEYLLVLDSNFKGFVYPSPASPSELLQESMDDIIFYNHNEQGNNLEGYKFINNTVERIWNLNFAEQESILQISSSYNDGNNPKLALFDDKKVILKHIDYTNFALITKNKGKGIYQGDGILNLYIINAKTGRILFNHNQQLVDLSQPINMVFDENSVFVSYFNPEKFLSELWVVEAFSKDMITSFTSIIEDHYISPRNKDDKFNYTEEDMNIIFLEQKYGFGKSIKSLFVVESKLKLTKRNLVLITSQDQVYSLDRNLVSTRRLNKDNMLKDGLKKVITFESSDLQPYNYLINLNHLQVQSYYLNIKGLNKVEFAPSNFESTSLYIAYGQDIFCSKIAPEKTFDMLSEDFNYLSLIATMILVIYMVIMIKKLAKKSLIFKLFHK